MNRIKAEKRLRKELGREPTAREVVFLQASGTMEFLDNRKAGKESRTAKRRAKNRAARQSRKANR